MAIVLHSNKTLLANKLLTCETQTIDKRYPNKTYIIEIQREKYDPCIPILSDDVLKRILLGKQPPPPPKPQQKLPKPPKPPSTSTSKQQRHPPIPPLKIPKLRLQNKQQPQQPHASTSKPAATANRPFKSTSSNKSPTNHKTIEFREPSVPKKPKEPSITRVVSREQPSPIRKPREPSPLPPTPPREPSQPKSFSYGESAVDKLVIIEEEDDFFSQFHGEDTGEESVVSKNLKKIRIDQPANKSNHLNNNQNKRPEAGTSASRPSNVPNNNNISNNSTSNGIASTEHQASGGSSGPLVVEHKWIVTENKFKRNDLDSTYADLAQHKDKIRSSEVAKRLLKELVLKCLFLDETKWFLDSLGILFELYDIYQSDSDLLYELIGRLQTKLSPVAKYKSKIRHEYVRSIYNEALKKLNQHLSETDPELKLRYSQMCFLTRPTHEQTEMKPNVARPLSSETDRKENSTPTPKVLSDRRVFLSNRPMVPLGGFRNQFPILTIKSEPKKEPPAMNGIAPQIQQQLQQPQPQQT